MIWEFAIIAIFIIGYALIVFEHTLNINKAAPALLIGVLTWGVYAVFGGDHAMVESQLMHHLAEISGILFFLLGAMTIVEIIDLHDGFHVITSKITTKDKRKLLWVICILTFVLSAVLDNLTTSIVMASLLRKIIKGDVARKIFVGMVVIAANAGGAFSPIGDVTTTMLWIGNQISAVNIIQTLFIPSLICMLVPLIILTTRIKGSFVSPKETTKFRTTPKERLIILFSGVGMLLFVPVFKTVTHLPPFMGMFFGLGALWLLTELLHKSKTHEEKSGYSVLNALAKVDSSSVLFFFGILAGIASLQSIGKLALLSQFLNDSIGNQDVIVMVIGVLSAIVDNVPLVAASQGMYSIIDFPTDSKLWEFMAYCAGTGGSMLIIGSAAGVAVMGIEKIDFIWYLKKIGLLALAGYLAGAAAFLVQYWLMH
ncbi:MAG: Na+/H+ antiporter NhaD/arsenite permease-like protein [Sphingobacteriales bacterium]|jgi:Na+/H+ antiporter NhaD/arsenite permease-like protein